MKTPGKFSQFSILFCVVTVFSTSLWAQPNQRRQPMLPDSTQIVHMVNDLEKTLSLSDKQQTKIADLYFAHFDQVKELMQKKTKRETMDKIRENFEKQVMAVLNDEQKAEYKKFVKRHKPRPAQQRPRR